MIKYTIPALALALSACTATPAMIEGAKASCTQLGHKPGSAEHAACAERSVTKTTGAQTEAVGAGAGAALLLGILNNY